MHVYAAGQQPKRQRVNAAPDPIKARMLMGQYLTGASASVPWEAMGMSKAPVIGGVDVVYDAVLHAEHFSRSPGISLVQ